ncbi:MAG TPA: NAD-dependent epimerase/dehydratase family protein, partial [Gemmatimonadaceae bacterium]|nr:NAD-dependent epimerase/dehydratase family protein [Gemmatimonadaceae bacterium]
MKVLVTGGTGVIGEATVTDLVRQGHQVRLLTRSADEAVGQWPDGVEAWTANICESNELKGCADGCDLVVHIAGIMEESP